MGDKYINMEELLAAERAGSGEAKMILSELAAEEHLEKHPELYGHVYDPHFAGLRGDALTRVSRDFIDRKTNEQSYNMNKNNNTPSSSINSTGVKRGRSISPTRESLNNAKNENIENDRKKRIREAYQYYTTPVINALRWAITPKKKVNPESDSLTPGNIYRKDNSRMHARKRGGSKKTRKSKKSSRRNRK
jgi:hypothetical protein